MERSKLPQPERSSSGNENRINVTKKIKTVCPICDCTKLVMMTPNVLDMSESGNGTICIYGDGISPGNLESVECSLKKDDKILVDAQGDILEGKVLLEFPLPSDEGLYDFYCNSSIGIEFKKDAQIVNTANLIPIAVNKPTVFTWSENNVAVHVSKMSGPADVICFARDKEGNIVYKEWTSAVEGNSLSSNVTCPRLVLMKPGEVELGIAYSEKAIEIAKTLKVTGVALSPNPMTAIYKSKESQLKITFDQNLEEENLDSCESIFKADTLSAFGKDPVCKCIANELHVFIKDKKYFTKTNYTNIEFTSYVKTKFSEAVVDESIMIYFNASQGKDTLRLEGEGKVCLGESTEVTLEGQQVGTPIWEVKPTFPSNLSSSNISRGQKQRANLIKWAVNRSSRAYPKVLTINTTGIPSGVRRYRVRATAADQTGEDRQATMDLSVARQGDIWLNILGPKELDIRAEALYEVVLRGCSAPVEADNYTWSITDDEGGKISTGLQNFKTLHLVGSQLQPNVLYTVSARAFKGETFLAAGELKVKSKLDNFELRLPETSMVFGTGHGIEIDASTAVDFETELLKFKWTCMKGYCFVPGKEKAPFSTHETTLPALRLPPKSLAIGRYQLEVEAVMESARAKAELEINVISGQPPYFSSLRISERDPGKDVAIQIQVSEILAPCDIYWQSVPELGYSFIEIDQKKTRVDGSPTNPESTTVSIKFAKETIQAGGKYKLRAIADCGRLVQSHFEFQLEMPDGFPTCQVQVDPKEGRALETKYVYKVSCNESLADYLLRYGFEENTAAKYLSTGYNKEFTTILGQGHYKTVTKLCKTNYECITFYGPDVTNLPAQNLEEANLQEIVSAYNYQLRNSQHENSKNFLEMIVPAVIQVDKRSYEKLSELVLESIVSSIKLHIQWLSNGTTEIYESVKLLDLAISTLTILNNNEEATKEVLQFRDLIHRMNQVLLEKNMEKKLSAKLPAEPRGNPEEKVYSRKKRSAEDANHKKLNTENTILTVSASIQNITDNKTKINEERINLLHNIPMYAALFCNGTDKKEADSDNGYCSVRSSKWQPQNDNKLPDCHKVNCTYGTGKVKSFKDYGKKNINKNFCLATGYIQDDLLSVVSTRNEHNITSVGPIFWVDLLPRDQNGIVRSLSNYSSLLPMNSSNSSELLTTVPIKTKGNVTLQLPYKWEPPKDPSKRFILKCSRYEYGKWNTNSCKILVASQALLNCICPYPGYYSVFAVLTNGTKNHTNSVQPPGTTVTSNVIPVSPVPNPDHALKTESTTTVTSVTTKPVLPVTNPQNSKITLNNTAVVTTTTKPGAPNPESATTKPVTPHPESATTKPVTPNPVQATSAITSTEKNPTKSSRGEKVNVPATVSGSTSTLKPSTGVSNQNGTRVDGTDNATKINSSTTQVQTTALPQPERTTSQIQQQIDVKYIASFYIVENYTVKVEKNEDKFLQSLIDQLQSNYNITLLPHVKADRGKILVSFDVEKGRDKEQTKQIKHLDELIKNGNLTLKSLDGTVLNIPKMDLKYHEPVTDVAKVSSATGAFIFAMILFLLLLIFALITAIYQRNTRQRRCHRLTRSLQEDPPAPKYLRLLDTVSLGSSGPSTPSIDMESSLAVVTRQRRSGYNTMDTFSNIPGNI